MKRSLSIFLLVLCLALSSCSSKSASCSDILSGLIDLGSEEAKRNGQVFLLSAEEGRIEYFSEENRALMYGAEAVEHCFSKIEDCAVFTSSHTPEEIAVFKCYSASDTDKIAKMCLSRADNIKIALRGSAWQEKSEKIRVTIYRRFVVFAFTDQPEIIESRVRRLV